MILWTIQQEYVYDELIDKGIYRTDEGIALPNEFADFKMPYDWLVAKMISLIGNPPDGVKYPVWAWHTWEGKRKRRDLRSTGYGNKGTRLVQMEIDIPDHEVVLTDFDLWVAILNGLNLNIRSEEEFENDYYCSQAAKKSEHYTDYMNDIIKSWDECIEPTSSDNIFLSEDKSIQATFWELKKEQVKHVWHFVCR